MENLFVSDRFNNKWMIWKEITHACRTFKPRDLFLPANNDLRHVQKEKSPLTTKSLANHTLRRRHRNGEMTHGNVLTAQNTDARNIFPRAFEAKRNAKINASFTLLLLCANYGDQLISRSSQMSLNINMSLHTKDAQWFPFPGLSIMLAKFETIHSTFHTIPW